MVGLNVAIVGHDRTEMLTLALLIDSVIAADAFFQQLVYYAACRLRQALERMYSTVCVPSLMGLPLSSGATASSFRWKGEMIWDEKESELVEGCPTETRQSFTKTSRP